MQFWWLFRFFSDSFSMSLHFICIANWPAIIIISSRCCVSVLVSENTAMSPVRLLDSTAETIPAEACVFLSLLFMFNQCYLQFLVLCDVTILQKCFFL